ncbi:Eco57I restriction-modification methylase domain-containing protein [Clostridium sp. DL1XJH146]
MNDNTIFDQNYLNKLLDKYDINKIPKISDKLSIIKNWNTGINDKSIYKFSEKELQSTFLVNIFDKILGYKSLPFNSDFFMIPEQSTKLDGSKPDATLGYFNSCDRDVQVVIELKDAYCDLDVKQKRLNDNRTPIEQAFSYAPKYGSRCKWVIVSNFIEIRLYHASNQLAYQQFNMKYLTDETEFLRFYYILNKDNLISKSTNSRIDELYTLNIQEEQNITKNFYKTFKTIRQNLLEDIINNNDNIDPIIAIEKTQKILDRIIFICFCKDSPEELLPHDILNRIFSPTQPSFNPLWDDLKLLFNAIDIGNTRVNIHKFNGGLFKKDPLLDNLNISDNILKSLKKIISINFSSDLNTNILGHIFEQGITDIEYLKNYYRNKSNSSEVNIRKKEGIYYTPVCITQFIIHQALSKWLDDRKTDLGYYKLPTLSDEEKFKALKLITNNYRYHKKETTNDVIVKKYKINLEFWENYRKVLINIKVIDISCGSGAFLNQAFSFLYNESKKVNTEIYNLYDGQEKYFNIDTDIYKELDKNILQNNIFGIDINKESIDITRLSLWLLTANKEKCLATLDDNIICRDSIVYDDSNEDDKNLICNNKFKDVISKGGFDIVIGNPPYIDSEQMTRNLPDVRKFCKKHYKSAKGNWDMFIPFIEKGLNILKNNGILCYIVPNKLIGASYSQQIRKIISQYTILQFRDYSEIKVFDDANVYPIIFSIKKSRKKTPVSIQLFDKSNDKWIENIISPKIMYRDINWNRYFVKDTLIINILEKMLRFTLLEKIATVKEAATVAEAYKIKEFLISLDNVAENEKPFKKFINTGTIDKYKSLWGIKPARYIKNSYLKPVAYTNDIQQLNNIRSTEANSEKIIVAGMCKELECYYDNGQYLAGKSTSIIMNSEIDLQYILALLNSKLISFFYSHYYRSNSLSGGYFNINANQLKNIPIAFEESTAKQIIKEVIKIDASIINRKDIVSHQTKIDNLVYMVYGLDFNEVYLVENEV